MKKFQRITTYDMIKIAMFSALLTVLSQISFNLPGGIPITLQTFGIFIIGNLLGPIQGVISILVYLLMGIVGIPVFTGFRAGANELISPTGGFLIGFLPMVFIIGLGKKKMFLVKYIYNILGLLSCYILGLLMYYYITKVWLLPSIPFMLFKDVITCAIAILFSKELSLRLSLDNQN
jgi:biotin transport system substrate-specific component